MYCVCEKQAEPNDEDFYTDQCSLSDSIEYCPSDTQSKPGNNIPINPIVTTCTSNMQKRSLSHRNRRSVTDSDDLVLDTIPLEYDDDVNDNITVILRRFGHWHSSVFYEVNLHFALKIKCFKCTLQI